MVKMHSSNANSLRVKPLAACLALPFALVDFVSPSFVTAATLQVTNCNDAGSGSLRQTVAAAQSGDTVDLRGLNCGGVISLVSGELAIDVADLTLIGPGANNLMLDDGNLGRTGTMVNHRGSGTLRLERLSLSGPGGAYTIVNNSGVPTAACVTSNGTLALDHAVITQCKNSKGGAIVHGLTMQDSTVSHNNRNGVTVTGGAVSIIDSTISDNDGFDCVALNIGKGDANGDRAVIRNTTISSNTAGYTDTAAGCIHRPVTISSSTVAFNESYCGLGCGTQLDDVALFIDSADVTIESTIFSNNNTDRFAGNWHPSFDVLVSVGAMIGGHNNLMMGGAKIGQVPADTISADPLLQSLADNGGPTMTHALRPGSPAIDAGNNLAELPNDQRGFLRTAGAAPDIGAFELQATIDASFTGSWFDPAQAGHGLMIEVLPDNRLLALWFAFNPQGTEQSWFGGVGTYGGDTAVISDVRMPSGGRWLPYFDPGQVVSKPWGSLTFAFSDHDHGKVSFNSVLDYGSGSMDLFRLTGIAEKNVALSTPIGSPGAVTTDAAGNVYFSSDPNMVFKIDPQGTLTHIAGSGAPGFSGDGGAATLAQLNFPLSYPELVSDPVNYSELVGGLSVDRSGNIYIADAYNNRVRRIDPNGVIETVVGTGAAGYTGDGGIATNASIHWPQGVATDAAGNLYVSTAYASVRKITSDGRISTLAGSNCGSGYLGPGVCAPEQIAVDGNQNVFVPDGYCRVREIRQSAENIISTIAGADNVPSNGTAFTCGYSGDNGTATRAALSSPYAVATDDTGSLYIADTGNSCIRKVSSGGIINTVAGICNISASQAGYSGDGGLATDARLNGPHGLAVNNEKSIFIADTYNHRIRKVSANGAISTVAGNGAELPSTNSYWTEAANLGTPRVGHTATLLQTGKVLVVGGTTTGRGTDLLDSAELYDPATNTWSPTSHLSHARASHSATLLRDGTVLVAGGLYAGAETLTSAEVYDPASGRWTDTARSPLFVTENSMVSLRDGRVLVVQGSKAELYDPTTRMWTLTGGPILDQAGAAMTLLKDGKVLISGGTSLPISYNDDGVPVKLAEVYDPVAGTWAATGSMNAYHGNATASLRDGRVLVCDNGFGAFSNVTEVYDPGAQTWSITGVGSGSAEYRDCGTLTLLASGEALSVGGAGTGAQSVIGDAELYNPSLNAWAIATAPHTSRFNHTATLLSNGKVLIAGGSTGNAVLRSAELYTPSPPAVSIDASFSGSWFDPDQSGHGLMVEVLPDNHLLALWFAFSPDGTQQSWLGGVGTYTGNAATITDVALPVGGRWIPHFDPTKVVREPWGKLTFTFSDCNHGTVDFTSTLGYGSGSMNLTRLTMPAGLSCP